MPYFGVTPGTAAGADLNGKELILDADADTTITADTDDQIDIKIAGADDFQFTADTFTAQSGSTIAAQALTATTVNATGLVTAGAKVDLNGTELILDADADTSITADTDDQIDIRIAGADDFQFTANTFNILSGSTLAVNSGATIANSGTATGFGKIVGVKSVTVATLTSTTGTSYVDATGVTLDYAQVASGNYCLVTCIGTMQAQSTSPTQIRPWMTLLRDAGTVAVQSFNVIGTLAGGNLLHTFSGCIQGYVSAGDTDSSTYKLQIKGQNSDTACAVTWGSGISGNSTTVLSIMEFEV